METLRIDELWANAEIVYNTQSMNGFEQWVDEYDGSAEEKDFLTRFRGYLRVRNSGAEGRVFSLDSIVLEDFLRTAKTS